MDLLADSIIEQNNLPCKKKSLFFFVLIGLMNRIFEICTNKLCLTRYDG